MSIVKTSFAFYKDLPPWAKGVVVVGGGLVAVVTVFVAYKKISNAISGIKESGFEKEPVKEAKQDLATLAKKGIKPTYSDQQFSAWAEKVQNQFGGCDITSVAVISIGYLTLWEIVRQFKNDADFAKFVEVFDMRTIKGCWSSGSKMNLYSAIADELNVAEIAKLNASLAKGITYKF